MSVKFSQKTSCSKPIFIVGSGRSGTTLLYRFMRGHPDLAWISRLTDRCPQFPQLSFFSRYLLRKIRWEFQPSLESINAFNYCGITNDFLKEKGASLTEDDVTGFAEIRLSKMVSAHMKWMGKARFINKNTANTMRIRYIRKIFPGSFFIHIIRNGYAVSNSLYNAEWWPDLELWWLKRTPRQWQEEGRNPYELCARHWKRQVTEILNNKDHIPREQYFECRYEDLLENTHSVLENIMAFCQLEWKKPFKRHVNKISINVDNRDKWQRELDASAKKAVSGAAGDLIRDIGYKIVS